MSTRSGSSYVADADNENASLSLDNITTPIAATATTGQVQVSIPEPFKWFDSRGSEKSRPSLRAIDVPSRLKYTREMKRYLRARRDYFQKLGRDDPYEPSIADGIADDVRRAIVMAAKFRTEEPLFDPTEAPKSEEDFKLTPVLDWISLRGRYVVDHTNIQGKSIKEAISEIEGPNWRRHGLETALALGLEEISHQLESDCPQALIAGSSSERLFVKLALRNRNFVQKWRPPLIGAEEVLVGGSTWVGLVDNTALATEGDEERGLSYLCRTLWKAATSAVRHHPKIREIQAYHYDPQRAIRVPRELLSRNKRELLSRNKRERKRKGAGKPGGRKKKGYWGKQADEIDQRGKNGWGPTKKQKEGWGVGVRWGQQDPQVDKVWSTISRNKHAFQRLTEQSRRDKRAVCVVCGAKPNQDCGGWRRENGKNTPQPKKCKKADNFEKYRPLNMWKALLTRAKDKDSRSGSMSNQTETWGDERK